MNFMKETEMIEGFKHGHQGSPEIFQPKLQYFSFRLPRFINAYQMGRNVLLIKSKKYPQIEIEGRK